jgi:hypothetical protein
MEKAPGEQALASVPKPRYSLPHFPRSLAESPADSKLCSFLRVLFFWGNWDFDTVFRFCNLATENRITLHAEALRRFVTAT